MQHRGAWRTFSRPHEQHEVRTICNLRCSSGLKKDNWAIIYVYEFIRSGFYCFLSTYQEDYGKEDTGMYARDPEMTDLERFTPVCMSCKTCVCWSPRGSNGEGVCTHLAVWSQVRFSTKGVITHASNGCSHWISHNPSFD